MERAAHVEPHGALGAGLLAQHHRPLDARLLAADHELARAVVVRRHDEARLARRLGADLLDRHDWCRRGSPPWRRGASTPLSYISSPRRRTTRTASSSAQRLGGVIRRELAERVAGRRDDARADDVARRRPHRRAVREQRRLRVVRERELVGRPLEAERAERRAERRVGALEDVLRAAGNASARSLPIPGFCEPWPGKSSTTSIGQNRTTIEPHVKPAPNATSSTVVPSLTTPFSIASSSAIGIDADDVLP